MVDTVQTKSYPLEGSTDVAVGEYSTPRELALLDDFHNSGYLTALHEAVLSGDRDTFDRLLADKAVYVAERFGQGERQSKVDVLATFGGKAKANVKAHTREDVRLIPFGENTVVMTGRSVSVFHYQGRLSTGPRLFVFVYMKIQDQWQCVVHAIMDYDGTMI